MIMLKLLKRKHNGFKGKMNELLNAPEVVRNYQKISRDYICDKYNWDKVVDETLNLYILQK